jgi:hypothetical protein
LSFSAQFIAIGFTIAIKLVVLMLLRARFFSSFYRKQPAGANIMMVVMECWNLGLSSGYILARSMKLILLAIFYIARVDTPFLADDVGYIIGDTYPEYFRKDILIHEAVSVGFVRCFRVSKANLKLSDSFFLRLAIKTIKFIRLSAPSPIHGAMGTTISIEVAQR